MGGRDAHPTINSCIFFIWKSLNVGWVERSETQQSAENVGFRPSNATEGAGKPVQRSGSPTYAKSVF